MSNKDRSTKVTNVEFELTEMDVKRVQAVIDGELDPKWVSEEEILAINDKLYDTLAGKMQTHLGVLTIQ
jgi:hypothetical protein